MVTENQSKIEVYSVGSWVKFGGKNALVTSVMIGPNNTISYNLVWWFNHERFEQWIPDIELEDCGDIGISVTDITCVSIEEDEESFGFNNFNKKEKKNGT